MQDELTNSRITAEDKAKAYADQYEHKYSGESHDWFSRIGKKVQVGWNSVAGGSYVNVGFTTDFYVCAIDGGNLLLMGAEESDESLFGRMIWVTVTMINYVNDL